MGSELFNLNRAKRNQPSSLGNQPSESKKLEFTEDTFNALREIIYKLSGIYLKN